MMVFNPIYMQKAGDSEAQLLGGSFLNQKPTYLFSDIIKVILAKTEQAEGGENIATADSSTNTNPLLISDAEVELFDKLMKLGITGTTSNELSGTESLNENSVCENLKMFLNGLTNQEEFASSEDKKFEIDKSDLLVLLNIFAGNISEQNNFGNSDVDSSVEINSFIEEINSMLDGIGKSGKQQIVIQQSDFTLELEPAKNGKITVKIGTPSPNESQSQMVLESDGLVNASQLSSDSQSVSGDFSNVEYSYVQNQSSEQSNNVFDNEMIELSDEDKSNISSTKTKWEQALNQSRLATTETENISKNTFVKNDAAEKSAATIDTKPQTNTDGNIVKNLSDNQKSSASDITTDKNSTDVKEFFEGKIKVQVINKEDNSIYKEDNSLKNTNQANIGSKAQQQIQKSGSVSEIKSSNIIPEQSTEQPDLNAIELKLKENLVKDNINSQISAKTSEVSKDSQQKTIPVKNPDATFKQESNESFMKVKSVMPEKVDSSDKAEISVENNIRETAAKTEKANISSSQLFGNETLNDDQLQKNDTVKNPKQKIQKSEADVQLKTDGVNKSFGTELKSVQNESKQVEMPVVADGKTSSQKVDEKNQDTENVVSDINKNAKSVSTSQESSNQKSDKQNQNMFEKTFATVNKAEQLNRETKETVKVVEQSRLMNEIENVIKSGDRKVVILKIYPEELGSVKISLDFTDNNVSAKINVTNDSVRQVILTQSENLKSSLSESGIQLAALNVSVDNSDEKANPQTKAKKKSANSDDKKVVIKDIPNPVKIKNLGYNTYDFVV